MHYCCPQGTEFTNISGHLLLDPLNEFPEMLAEDKDLVVGVHSCLEGLLYNTAINLIFYWILYGVFLSYKYPLQCIFGLQQLVQVWFLWFHLVPGDVPVVPPHAGGLAVRHSDSCHQGQC